MGSLNYQEERRFANIMEKKLYETMLLVDAGIGDEGIPEIIRHATELMGRYGGEIERVEKWGEGELAYSIAGTTHGPPPASAGSPVSSSAEW